MSTHSVAYAIRRGFDASWDAGSLGIDHAGTPKSASALSMDASDHAEDVVDAYLCASCCSRTRCKAAWYASADVGTSVMPAVSGVSREVM